MGLVSAMQAGLALVYKILVLKDLIYGLAWGQGGKRNRKRNAIVDILDHKIAFKRDGCVIRLAFFGADRLKQALGFILVACIAHGPAENLSLVYLSD
jgi:hypothetical protein